MSERTLRVVFPLCLILICVALALSGCDVAVDIQPAGTKTESVRVAGNSWS